MELPFKQSTMTHITNKIQSYSTQFIQTFSQNDFTRTSPSFIMPIHQVEKLLHDHYVSDQPVLVTYEYYDENNVMKNNTLTCYVVSPIQTDYSIDLEVSNSATTINLPLEHILTMSANID